MIENKNYISEIELPEGPILALRDSESIPINDEVVVYNSAQLREAIGNARPNTTILLADGKYDLLTLTSNEFHGQALQSKISNEPLATKFPKNLTLKSENQYDAVFHGLSITSGVPSTEQHNINIQRNILPEGLTLDGITFDNYLTLRNCQMEKLTIKNCKFINNSGIYLAPQKTDDEIYGYDKNSEQYASEPTQTLFGYHKLWIKDVLITDCLFDFDENIGKSSAHNIRINVNSVENITIQRNTFNGSWTSALQVLGGTSGNGYATKGGFASASGNIRIGNNKINNCRERAFKIYRIENAIIELAYNTIKNTDVDSTDSEVIKISEIRDYNSSIYQTKNTYTNTAGTTITLDYNKTDIYLEESTGGNNLKINGKDNIISIIEKAIKDNDELVEYIISKIPRYTGEEDI